MLGCVTDVEGLGGVGAWAPDNRLGADGAAALADPLGKLVHLASLDVRGTWHGGVGCVACVYACSAVSECAWEVVALWGCVTDVEGLGWVCGCARQWTGSRWGSSIGGCAGEAGAPDESEFVLYVAWGSGVCVACVYAAVPCPSVSGRLWQYEAV